jgi:hypothetical protein
VACGPLPSLKSGFPPPSRAQVFGESFHLGFAICLHAEENRLIFWGSLMDDTRCREFFLEPRETYQRQYEALRAFFVEGRPLNEIAQQFGYQESSLNVMISNFRNQVKANNLRPFLFSRGSDGRKGGSIS